MPEGSVTLRGRNRPAIAGRPVFACLKRTGKSRLLDASGEMSAHSVGVDEHVLAIHSPRVAFVLTAYYLDAHETFVRVRDLRGNGGGVRSCSAGVGLAPRHIPRITKVVLNGKGSVAWSALQGLPAPGNAIVACDSAGKRTLDSGEGVDLESLSLQRSVLSWLDNGSRREARLE